MFTMFKPAGIPAGELEMIELSIDELEAIRLADHEGLYQEDAAMHLHVSRQTFGNILTSAHRKVAAMLIGGRGLLIRGGAIAEEGDDGAFLCPVCRCHWVDADAHVPPTACPRCEAGAAHHHGGESSDTPGHGIDTCRRRHDRRRGSEAGLGDAGGQDQEYINHITERTQE